MIIFFSGSAGFVKGGHPYGEPEWVLGDAATVMLSYFLVSNRMQDQETR